MKFFKEPLLHFLLIGGLFFAIFSYVNPNDSRGEKYINIDAGRIESIIATFNKTWNRYPSEQELKHLIDQYVLEEIYYRQALAMGLDQDDPLIRKRLRQKMEFFSNASTELAAPTEQQLHTLMQKNPAKYTQPDNISFEQVFISQSQFDESQFKIIKTKLNAGEPVNLTPSMLEQQYQNASEYTINRTFGKGFIDDLRTVKLNSWQGPLQSGLGLHFVKVIDRQLGQLYPLAEVRELVTREWRYEQEKQHKNKLEQQMLSNYNVEISWPKLAASSTSNNQG